MSFLKFYAKDKDFFKVQSVEAYLNHFILCACALLYSPKLVSVHSIFLLVTEFSLLLFSFSVSASWELGLQACAIKPGLVTNFLL